jgi:hypothetical protein
MLYRVHLVINGIQTHNVSAKSNHHTITTTTVPVKRGKKNLYHAVSNGINKKTKGPTQDNHNQLVSPIIKLVSLIDICFTYLSGDHGRCQI